MTSTNKPFNSPLAKDEVRVVILERGKAPSVETRRRSDVSLIQGRDGKERQLRELYAAQAMEKLLNRVIYTKL